MSRGPHRFKQNDVERAIRAARAAKTPMAVDILPNGTIRLLPTQPLALNDPSDSEGDNPWDQ